ncbi:class I SAM-dependent methyltransferase [Cellulomonas sp. P22]|uniref:class I SAM-dependent methyltransferase n=1 Tax=Cellulomonas sp. P22 TaxID=3373189 RepID=UPI0037970E5C
MSVARTVEPLLRQSLGQDVPIRIRCWDGSTTGPATAPVQLTLRRRRALRHLLWSPDELGFARAFVAGDLTLEGDLLTGLEELQRVAAPGDGPGVQVTTATKLALARAAIRLGVVGPRPRPPAEEVRRLRGVRHSKSRDAQAVSHHYDIGNDFYRLVLGDTMTYSCAYWDRPDADLDAAQIAKCDLVARKLGLRPGMRVLDVGCGWGTFALHAARTYGVHVVGVTLAREQAAFARKRMADEGVADLVEIRVQDYRDVHDGPYDAIASVGMAEHVGAAMLSTYSADLFALLRPEGRLLNHAIARRPRADDDAPAPRRGLRASTSFVDRYVFPDGELETLATMVGAIEGAGFEVRDVESLREHYALTLRAWVANLESRWDEAVAVTSAGRARVWRLYMAGSVLAFESGRIGVNQVLAVRPASGGTSGMPRTRETLLARQVAAP